MQIKLNPPSFTLTQNVDFALKLYNDDARAAVVYLTNTHRSLKAAALHADFPDAKEGEVDVALYLHKDNALGAVAELGKLRDAPDSHDPRVLAGKGGKKGGMLGSFGKKEKVKPPHPLHKEHAVQNACPWLTRDSVDEALAREAGSASAAVQALVDDREHSSLGSSRTDKQPHVKFKKVRVCFEN